MSDDEVVSAKVEFEDVTSQYRKVDDFDPGSWNLVESGESTIAIPVLTGSLPNVGDIEATLTRDSTETSSTGFELKLFGIGASRSAKVTIERSIELALKAGETKTRYLEVPVAWQKFSHPSQPDRTRVVVTPGIPPDGRYDIRVDSKKLPGKLATTNRVDNQADGLLTDTDKTEVARGSKFSLDVEVEGVSATGAISVGVEEATTTTVKYSLPRGRYELTWLEGSTGLYVETL